MQHLKFTSLLTQDEKTKRQKARIESGGKTHNIKKKNKERKVKEACSGLISQDRGQWLAPVNTVDKLTFGLHKTLLTFDQLSTY
jgi:hypothetical protein